LPSEREKSASFLTRRWDVEIGEFAKDYSGYDLEKRIKEVIQKRLKKASNSNLYPMSGGFILSTMNWE
jgi:hypothetical protein